MRKLIDCPGCHEKLEVDSSWRGKECQCPYCKSTIKIPDGQFDDDEKNNISVVNKIQRDRVKQISDSKWIILVWIVQTVIIASLLLVLINKLNPSPESYEYQIVNFDRNERRQFNNYINELANDGWEYVGVLTNNGMNSKEVLFRRNKRNNLAKDKQQK